MRTILRTLVALLLPAAALAQDSTRLLLPGTPVRLTLDNRQTLSGRASSSTDTTFTVQSSFGLETVRLANVQRTDVRQGSARRGAVIGGLVGAGIGIWGAYAFKDMSCQYDGCSRPAYPVHGAVYAGVPAAILGGFAGAFIQRWVPEPRRIAVAASKAAVAVAEGRVIDGRDCSTPLSGNASMGMTTTGGFAADGSIVINCRPERWLSIAAAWVDTPDDYFGYYGELSARHSVSRISLVGERFLFGGVRGSFSIDRVTDRIVRPNGLPTLTRVSPGAGVGISAAKRLQRSLALRGAFQLHAHDGHEVEKIILFGLERIR